MCKHLRLLPWVTLPARVWWLIWRPAALLLSSDAEPAYVSDQTPNELGSFMTNFFFDPNGTTTGDDLIEIFSGLGNGAESIFGIQFQHTLENPDSLPDPSLGKSCN